MRWLNSSSALAVRIFILMPISYSRIWYIRFRSRRCSRLIPKRNPPSGPLTFSYRRCIVLRPAVMGLYVERRCSTIREDTSETRMRPQPFQQDMPEPAGTQKRQRKSRMESNSFLLTKHIFYHSHRLFAVCAFTGKQKKGPTNCISAIG